MSGHESEVELNATAVLKALQSRYAHDRENMPLADQAELEGYYAQHDAYLADIVSDVKTKLSQSGAVVQEFSAEHPSIFARERMSRKPLDLASLGLPEQTYTEYGGRPLLPYAVLIHHGPTTNPADELTVRGVELLCVNDETTTLSSQYLENVDVAVNGATVGNLEPHWATPGDARIIAKASDVTGRISGPQEARMLQIEPTFNEHRHYIDGGSTIIIRPKPTTSESRAGEKLEKKSHKLALSLAALGLTGLVMSPPIGGADPNKNQPLNTASEVVGHGNVMRHDGLEQAESLFDSSTLARARAAVRAYIDGNRAELEILSRNYHVNWMTPESLQAISAAGDSHQLEIAFTQAFDGIPIHLSILDTKRQADDASESTGVMLTPIQNFTAAKQQALAAAKLYDLFDKGWLEKSEEPLNIVIAHKIDDTDAPGYKKYEAVDGIYIADSSDSGPNIILLADNSTTPKDQLIAHENTHHLDDEQAGILTRNTYALDLSDHTYTGDPGYENTSTFSHHWHDVSEPYGNAAPEEDTATDGERIFVPTPKLTFENSPFSEKEMAIVFDMEDNMPGFTAALLLRERPFHAGSGPNTFERALFVRDQYWQAIFGGSMLMLATAAAIAGRSKHRNGQIRKLQANSVNL